jgi:hypothetical protein
VHAFSSKKTIYKHILTHKYFIFNKNKIKDQDFDSKAMKKSKSKKIFAFFAKTR